LTRNLETLEPDDIEDSDEWMGLIEDLWNQIEEDEYDGAWRWYIQYFPKCMALVPKRRKEQFVNGVRRYYDEHIA